MGLEIDRHDELPLVSIAENPAPEREAAAAYVTRRARDDEDRSLLLAALGLGPVAGAAALALTLAASVGLLWLGHHINQGGHRG
ncbi:hypothetical protein [Streptomyces sp. NPDC012888]|uniref:hypothetical protein n=1 Tax=Streptomyces sp. NPDC012888 TaxID=3364855 RepID=UPI00369B6DD5